MLLLLTTSVQQQEQLKQTGTLLGSVVTVSASLARLEIMRTVSLHVDIDTS